MFLSIVEVKSTNVSFYSFKTVDTARDLVKIKSSQYFCKPLKKHKLFRRKYNHFIDIQLVNTMKLVDSRKKQFTTTLVIEIYYYELIISINLPDKSNTLHILLTNLINQLHNLFYRTIHKYQ